jgi:hypothetical protein
MCIEALEFEQRKSMCILYTKSTISEMIPDKRLNFYLKWGK